MTKFQDMPPAHREHYEAYLSAQGYSNKEICNWLNDRGEQVTESTVSRDLQSAILVGWLIRRFAEENLDAEALHRLRESVHHKPWETLEGQLKEKSGNVLKSLSVFYSLNEASESQDRLYWDKRLKQFAGNASWRVDDLLKRSVSGVGVGWGKTISTVVTALQMRNGKSDKASHTSRNIRVIPTVGDPLGDEKVDLDISSSSIAARLHEYLNAQSKNLYKHSLEGIAPVIPKDFIENDKRAIILQYISKLRSYQEIFGTPNDSAGNTPLIRKVDTLLTSAGSFHSWQDYKSQQITIGGVQKGQVEKLSIGDIGGVLIPNAEVAMNPQLKKQFEQVSALWTGIQLSDYQRIAEQAAKNQAQNSPAGVVLCVIGANKAEVVYELITRIKVVNTLICDYAIAKELQHKFAKPETVKAASSPRS